MGKKSKKATASSTTPTPIAPWVYIHDPTTGTPHIRQLHTMLPDSVIVHNPTDNTAKLRLTDILLTNLTSKTEIPLIADNYSGSSEDLTKKLATANAVRDAAIKHGSNFVSVNIYEGEDTGTKKEDLEKWGTNHLEIKAGGDDEKSQKEVAQKIHRWLFKVLTPHETIHLIPESEMLVRDTKSFPDYAYCPINESRLHPKDAKIQFIAIVLTRPVVGPDQKLTWTVADRTGVANFYFQYRGSSSQYTWDWCLALQPGDRKALPRMPMVEVKERKRVRIAKAPFRGIGLAISGVGLTVRAVGQGVAKLGSAVKMGPSSQWVPEGDVVDGKIVNWANVFDEEKKQIKLKVEREMGGTLHGHKKQNSVKVFNEKGEKLWKDDDSIASTQAGADCVNEKEFV